jgi:la-related protein 1
MVTVYLDLSHPFPPLSPDKLIQNSMSASPLSNQPTSVFKALGSYADRIRDQNGQLIKSPPSTSTPLQTPARSSSMSASNTASASASTKVSTPVTPAESAGVEVQVDDGPWETVHSTKTKGKQGDRDHHVEKGSNSRNWRDRPMREKAGESSKEGQGEKKASGSVGGSGSKSKKGSTSASSSVNATRTNGDVGKAQSSTGSRTQPTPSIAAPAKPAWGLPTTKPVTTNGMTAPQSTDPIPTAKPTATAKTNTPAKTSTAPPSPSLNGTTAVSSVSGDTLNEGTNPVPAEPVSTTPATKPSQKKEPSPSNTKEAPAITKKEEAPVETSTPVVPAARVVAPPPTNPWNVVKPTLASPAIITVAASAKNEPRPSSRIQFGQLSFTDEAANPLPNGMSNGSEEAVKIGGKKKKKDTPAAVVIDASQWPDVAQAQTVGVKNEKKEPKPVEESVEESTTTSMSTPLGSC